MKNEILMLTMTLLVFVATQKFSKKFKFFLFNPLLLSIITLVLILFFTGIKYENYMEGGKYISFFLAPSVVALAVPLYQQIEKIKRNAHSILLSVSLGAIMGIVSSSMIALFFGGSKEIALSIIPKSVTTPIAMDISSKIGGIPSLTVVTVIIAGLTGVIFGLPFLKLIGVKSTKAIGLAMGTASHGTGTARVSEVGAEYGAYGGIAIATCGIVSAVGAPVFVKLFF